MQGPEQKESRNVPDGSDFWQATEPPLAQPALMPRPSGRVRMWPVGTGGG
jgi:hypothetical protein